MTDQLPSDLEAERACLGALLLAPERAFEAVDLSPMSFHAGKNAKIFLAIVECLSRYTDVHGRPTADLKLVAGVLRERDQFEDIGPAYLMELVDGMTRSVNLRAYVQVLREYEGKRDALRGVAEIAEATRKSDVAGVRAALESVAARLKEHEQFTEVRRIDVRSVMENADIEVPWIIEGWLGEGDLCFLAGEWGTGKSLIAVDLAIAVAGGGHWLGKLPIEKNGPVLYLDEENNPVNASRRLRRMILGRNIDPELAATLPIHYLHGNGLNLDTRRGRDLLAKEVDVHKPVVIVLDSMIRFHRRDENKNSTMAAFFEDALRPYTRRGMSIVGLDHLRKPGEKDKDADVAHRLRGAGDKAGVADCLWTLEGNREEPTRTFQARKIRWEDSLPPSMTTEWKTSEDETAAWIECHDAQLSAEVAIARALAETNGQGMRANALLDHVQHRGVPRRTAIRIVRRLVQAHRITEEQVGGRGKLYRWTAP